MPESNNIVRLASKREPLALTIEELRTTGGTQGVGRATTQAMVMSTVMIFILDLVITKIFVDAV